MRKVLTDFSYNLAGSWTTALRKTDQIVESILLLKMAKLAVILDLCYAVQRCHLANIVEKK